MARLLATRLLIWGHGRSWVVLQVDKDGRTLWRSEWFRTRAEAELRAKPFQAAIDQRASIAPGDPPRRAALPPRSRD